MALEQELETYQQRLPELLKHEGWYVAICGTEVLGMFADYADALQVGYDRCGLNPFLVKKIERVESVQRFTRHVGLCRT